MNRDARVLRTLARTMQAHGIDLIYTSTTFDVSGLIMTDGTEIELSGIEITPRTLRAKANEILEREREAKIKPAPANRYARKYYRDD